MDSLGRTTSQKLSFMKLVLTLIAGLLFSVTLPAQRTEIGVLGGVGLYSGDLSPREFGIYLADLLPAGGAFLRHSPSRNFSFRIMANATQIRATDGISNDVTFREVNFRTRIFEFGGQLEWDFFRLGNPGGLEVAPYAFGGAVIYTFRPETFLDGKWIELQPLGTEGQGIPSPNYDAPYDLTQLALPVGLGVKLFAGELVTLGLEIGGRKLFTDYLDDVSDTYVNYLDILEGNGIIAARASNPSITDPSEEDEADLFYTRGGKYRDWYYICGLTLSIRLMGDYGTGGGGTGCPSW